MWASAAVIAGLLSAAACAHAQGQPWRHGIIEPKSDAGFQVMAVRGGELTDNEGYADYWHGAGRGVIVE